MTRVSVVIPAYNAAETLPDTLSSVMAQSWPHFEVIVVDDGSSDHTDEIIADFAIRDPRIKAVRQDNAGVAAARNHGLRVAKGDLIAPLDADDLWHPEKLARQVERIERAGPGAGMTYCWSSDIDKLGVIVHHRIALDRWEGDVFAPLVYANFVGNGSVPLIRKELLQAIGGWDPALREADAQGCEDWQLYLRIACRSDVVLVPGFLVGYRQGSQAMSRNIQRMHRSYNLVLSEARQARPDLPDWLFQWSEGAFELYMAELLFEAGDRVGAARATMRGIWYDPAWLARRSTLLKLGRALRRCAGPIARSRTIRPPPHPIGLHFSQLAPEPHREEPEGGVVRHCEARIDALRRRTSRAQS